MRNNAFDFLRKNAGLRALQELRALGFQGPALDAILYQPKKVRELINDYIESVSWEDEIKGEEIE